MTLKYFIGPIFLGALILMGIPSAVFAKSPGHDQLELGVRFYQGGKFLEAKAAFIQATQLDPGLLKAWENLGWAYRQTGEPSRAFQVWENVLMIEPHHTPILNATASLYHKQDQLERAIAYFEASLRADPSQIHIRVRLADAYTRTGQYDSAEHQLKQVLKGQPDNPVMFVKLAGTYEAAGKFQKAIALLRNHLAGRPQQEVLSLGTFRSLTLARMQRKKILSRNHQLFKPTMIKIRSAEGGGKGGRVYHVETQAVSTSPNLQAVCNDLHKHGQYCLVSRQPLGDLNNATIIQGQEDTRVIRALANLLAYQGDVAFQAQLFEKAQRYYQETLYWRPDYLMAFNNLGDTLEKQKQYLQAIRMWKESLTRHPQQKLLYSRIARAFFHAGDQVQAHRWFKKVVQISPANPEAHYRLFEFAMASGDFRSASHRLAALFSREQADGQWSNPVAESFLRHGEIQQGITFFLHRLPHSGNPHVSKQVLGRLLTKLAVEHKTADHIPEAIATYQQALHYDSENRIALRDLGWLYWKTGRWEDVKGIWIRYQQHYPDLSEPYNLLTHLHLHHKRYEEAIRSTTRSLDIDKNQPEQQLRLAKALYWAKRYPEAEASMAHLVKQYPNTLPIQYFFGEMLMQQRDFTRGVIQWKHVLDLGENKPRAHFYYLTSLYETQKYDLAIEQAQHYLNTHPPDKHIMKLIIHDALFRNDPADAIDWYEKLLEEFDDHPGDWLGLVQLYQKTGQPEQARLALNKAANRFPRDVEILLAAADLHLRTGRVSEAIKGYELVQQLTPDNRRAFIGLLNAYKERDPSSEALPYLDRQNRNFLKEYEADLERGALQASAKNFEAAKALFARVAHPTHEGVYVPILLYHGLSPHPRSKNLWVERFDHQLQALQQAGYTTITVQELAAMREGTRAFPQKPVMLTFDDARRDAFDLGDPVLRKYGMKATMFVPTARIFPGHPFFADWDLMRVYADTGRWDLQAHGHQAHDLIPIDESGTTGTFLTNYLWLEKEKRLETPQEFFRRLHQDYHTNIDLLKQAFSGLRVVGYAFPFSEAGQSSNGNARNARSLNEQLLEKFFQFGFIQDLDGYNWMAPHQTGTSMLRRVTVPREWDGEQLLKHLVEKHPANQAALTLAKTQYWHGLYGEAEESFLGLLAKEPRFSDKTKYYLASISYQGGRYWESQELLNSISQEETPLHSQVEQLKEKVDWQRRPRIFSDVQFFHDSNHRTNHSEFATAYFPLNIPVELGFTGGAVHFHEKRRGDFNGSEIKGSVKWHAHKLLLLEGAVRNRSLVDKQNTQSYWASAEWGHSANRLRLNWSYRDVDTVRAIARGIQVHTYSVGLESQAIHPFLMRLGSSYQNYDKGIWGYDIRASLQYRPANLKGWKIGTDLAYRDTNVEAVDFYAPDRLVLGLGQVSYQTRWQEDVSVAASLGLGVADDKRNGTRWVTNGQTRLDYDFTAQIRGGIAAGYSVVPGYKRVNVEGTLGYRF